MTGREQEEYIRSGESFYVFGDVMIYNPQCETEEPHRLYRKLMNRASLAVNTKKFEEYDRLYMSPYLRKKILRLITTINTYEQYDSEIKELCAEILKRMNKQMVCEDESNSSHTI